jgi:hypothetical protein
MNLYDSERKLYAFAGSSKAGLHKSRRTVETNQDDPNIPGVGRFVAPKNPYFVVAIVKHMRYSLVSSSSLVFFSVYIYIYIY